MFEKVVCSEVAGGHRDARDPPGAATAPLTPSLTSAPSRRWWPTLRPPLPQTHTDLIKPNPGGRNAPCSPKAEAPPFWAQDCSPRSVPPPCASQGTRSQPRGNLVVRGSKPTGPAASWLPFAPNALRRGDGEGTSSAAGEEPSGSPLHSGQGSRATIFKTASWLGTEAPELVSGK